MSQKKCFMCSCEINQETGTEIDGMCKQCAFKIWGPKMAEHINQQFSNAKEKGELMLYKTQKERN